MRGNVALIRMDDGKANALSYEMLAALHSALDTAEKDAKAIILAGREGRFCAGFDLKIMMSGFDAAAKLVGEGASLYMRLYDWGQPVVAACTGHALAGGALLLLVSDTRIGTVGEFKIGLNEVAIGLPLPILAQELARDRLSKRHLIAATLQARIHNPAEAVECGFLDEIVAAETVVDTAVEYAKKLAGLPGHAYAATKSKLRGSTIAHIRNTLEDDMNRLKPS